jgi:hypothetical protein
MYGGTRGLPAKKIEFPGLPNDKLCGDINSPTECFRAWGLNPEYRYRVTLLVEKDFDFSHSNGEARDGSLGITKLSSGEKRLRFSGSPVTFSTVVKTPLRPDVTVDKADSSHNYIGVYAHSTNSGQSQWLARCDYGRGMSLWYSGVLQSMPTWIAEESSLSLSVSSTHFRADGSKNLGTFNIEMPIKTAQCLWGVDLSRATQAVVSTVYPELDKQEIVTTSALVQGDFYKVSASGFHFSSPTIKVKVTQEDRTVSGKSSTDGSTKASSGAKTSSKKLQIICTKGKVRKIVIARNPSCPQGYQRTK